MYTSAIIKEKIDDLISSLREVSLEQYANTEIILPRYLLDQLISTMESAKREMSALEAASWR